ncbi:hypothetical protein EVAR_9004_1 [Eumeta japonica]|uniref:Uncharacterized protein n=1 Tax=Eumeta variegata TaxID=151549 RepID=A0A4C1WSY0_EUMVA|nr:hypothetical protein EVAR_9004_1 [Eumeta japonica]
MPRGRRASIGRRTRHASQQQVYSRNLSEERQNIIRENDRLRHRVSTRRSLASYNRLAFQYDPTANYSDDENLDIGRMTTICRYCNALKFKRETAGLLRKWKSQTGSITYTTTATENIVRWK